MLIDILQLMGCTDGSAYPAEGAVLKLLRRSSSEQPEQMMNEVTEDDSPNQ